MRVLPQRAPSRQIATTTAPQRAPSRQTAANPDSKTRHGKQTTHSSNYTTTQGFSHTTTLPRDNNREKPSTLLVAHHPGSHCPCLSSGSKPETRPATNTDTSPRHETTTSRSTSRNETSVTRPEATIAAESRTNTLPAQHRPDQTFRNGVRNDYRNGVRNGPTGEYTLDRVQCVFVPVKPVITTLRQSRFTQHKLP